VGVRRIRHLDKSETARLGRVSVLDDGNRLNRSVGREENSQLRFRGTQIQISNENVGHSLFQVLAT
jgi:hypothetical protein